jgi:hypothetical protein
MNIGTPSKIEIFHLSSPAKDRLKSKRNHPKTAPPPLNSENVPQIPLKVCYEKTENDVNMGGGVEPGATGWTR